MKASLGYMRPYQKTKQPKQNKIKKKIIMEKICARNITKRLKDVKIDSEWERDKT